MAQPYICIKISVQTPFSSRFLGCLLLSWNAVPMKKTREKWGFVHTFLCIYKDKAVIIKITGGVKWINGQQASGTTASLLFDLYIIKSTFVFFLFYPLRWCVFKKRHLFSSVWKRSSRFIPKWTSQRFFSPTDLFPIIILALQYSTQPSHREKHSPFHVKCIIARGFRIIQTVNWEKTIDNWRDKREEDKKKTTIGLGWWWVSKSRLFQVH